MVCYPGDVKTIILAAFVPVERPAASSNRVQIANRRLIVFCQGGSEQVIAEEFDD